MTAVLSAGLGGCQTMSDITGSITSKAEASPTADPKSAAETYGDVFRQVHGLEFVALRYGNVYGPRQDPEG